MKIIARIKSDFPEKFGIPRQSGLVQTKSRIVFEKQYAVKESVRGLEEFSHIWLIWGFSLAKKEDWSPTVRPPRLGGNKRVGVFATRSPYRPNSIGLSSVKLEGIEYNNGGLELIVSGADLADGTPIYDIKPYLPYTDAHSDAKGGFADEQLDYKLEVECDTQLLQCVEQDKRQTLLELLSQDPRPSYQNDDERVYGFSYSGYEIKFIVKNGTLYVKQISNSN